MSAQQQQQQPNAAAGSGDATWQTSITEQIRSQNLLQTCAVLLQSLAEPQRAIVLKTLYTVEGDIFATANSSQEYVTQLNARIGAIAQRLKQMEATQAQAQ
ncbi:hypothetical protein GGF42_004135, partial [Coemansia sp. RSA 2424]